MATPWDVSTAEYAEKSKYVGDEDINPYGVTFSSDGSKMYIMGYNTKTIYQYTLSTPWDVDTAVYAEKSKYVGDKDSPYGLTFSSDGSKMYIMGIGTDIVYQYTLSTLWDVSSAVYADKLKDVETQDSFPSDVAFSFDGSKMYIAGGNTDTVYQYTVSTPWDVSTATYATKSKDISAQDTTPYGLTFSSDGTKMYIMGYDNDTVYQYTLSTAWDVSTAEYATKLKDVNAQTSKPRDVTFSSDGSKMYIMGVSYDIVYQYTLPVVEADFEYTGTGTFAYSGTATQVHSKDYLTTASGQLAYSGTAEQVYSKDYLTVGSGSLTFSGEAVIIFGLAFVGSGSLAYSGEAVVTYTRNYLCMAVGELIYSGEAVFSYLCNFLFTASGELAYSGEADYSVGFTYTSSGEFVYSGAAECSYQVGGADFEYVATGSLTFSGIAIYVLGFAYTASGSFAYSGSATVSLGFSYTASGTFTFSGIATQVHSKNYLTTGTGTFNYNGIGTYTLGFIYVASGSYIFGGTAQYIPWIKIIKGSANWIKTNKGEEDWAKKSKGASNFNEVKATKPGEGWFKGGWFTDPWLSGDTYNKLSKGSSNWNKVEKE